MDSQKYKEMLHGIVVPESLSVEEQANRYLPFTNFLQAETPEKLYRFRACNKNNISAFDQDQIWFAPGSKMNDDFEALLCFNKDEIKNELKAFVAGDMFFNTLQSFAQGAEPPINIRELFSPEWLEAVRKMIPLGDPSAIRSALTEFYETIAKEIDNSASFIHEVVRKTVKFTCFSEAITSPAMWGYYADSSQGFALSYDFRNDNYTTCDTCPTREKCPSRKGCTLAPIIYGDARFDTTEYAAWLFQQQIIQQILAKNNAFSLYGQLQHIAPCPDLFMATKVLLHKASDWSHEKEWRLICRCNAPDFNQQESSSAQKRPTALYLGQKTSPIYEKILRHIATEKGIPVYKMQIRWDGLTYELHPQMIS